LGEADLDGDAIQIPPFLPDAPPVRNDILDYFAEVQDFDRQIDRLLQQLQAAGRSANTIVIMTSDNGWPFPRSKANLYDYGTRMPLVIRWPAKIKGERRSWGLISLTDLAPTLLEAAGVPVPEEMTGRSFLPLLLKEDYEPHNQVYLERERHAYVRQGNKSYPSRAIRTREFLYIYNLEADRWPAGAPFVPASNRRFGDIDNSPTKRFILQHRNEPGLRKYFELARAKRPPHELYYLPDDPYQLNNLAGNPSYADIQGKLHNQLLKWLRKTDDPRTHGGGEKFDHYPYFARIRPAPETQPTD
jgi:arylsulfatase A-like enzyme